MAVEGRRRLGKYGINGVENSPEHFHFIWKTSDIRKSIVMESRCSSSSTETSGGFFNWRENRQRLFIYWCFTHFIHGMIHSIRYSSQYLYFKDVLQVSNPDFLYGLSVSFIGATGVIFPLLISPYIDKTRNIKQAVITVNVLGLIGNLLYALPFSPAFPLIGQLLAGTTPAFGVIAMGEISRCYSSEKITKKVSGLSLIYSIGTFTSIGLVFCFLYVDFDIGAWNINFANMPGLFLALAFAVSTVLACFLVSDVSKEFDMKLEERIKRSSCGSTPNRLSSTITTPDLSSNRSSPNLQTNDASSSLNTSNLQISLNKQIPLIIEPTDEDLNLSEEERRFKVIREVGEPFFFNINADDADNAEGEEQPKSRSTSAPFSFPRIKKNGYERLTTSDPDDTESSSSFSARNKLADTSKCETVRITLESIWKILRFKTTAILMGVTFMEAFVYSIIVTSLPVLATKFLGWGKLELALLSMVNKFLSVIISGSVYFLTDYLHDYLLLCYGIGLSILALLTLSVLQLIDTNTTALIALMFAVATLSISGVPLIITSTRSMLAKMVPTEIQSLTEAVRMSIFEASFVPAGFLVPLVTLNVTATALILLLLMASMLMIALRHMRILVELKEDDAYWSDGKETPSNASSSGEP
ncbi:uncharacterized protein [Clytia hemisphaerica]|uniref:Uncharacterized protein n=1 Tax=Clytia hemisphaerica TaxID=252671 RepID=A0A7M5TRL2_9CNID